MRVLLLSLAGVVVLAAGLWAIFTLLAPAKEFSCDGSRFPVRPPGRPPLGRTG